MTGSAVPWALFSVWAVRFGVVALLLAVCLTDIRTRRIPNRLVLAGVALALCWQAFGAQGQGLFARADAGAVGIGQALAGAVVGFGVFLILYLFRTMGAGDVKLMAFVGAVFGLSDLPWLLLSVFATGGVLASLRMIDGERRRKVLANLRVIVLGASSRLAGGEGPRFDPRADTADRLPFAVAIVGGALILAVLQWLGWMDGWMD